MADALAMLASGATAVGGGAALASKAFAPVIPGDAVDLKGLGLDRLEPPHVGAMVTIARLVDSPVVRQRWPVVWQAASVTATPEVRRMATVGGTVAARIATSDLVTALCAAAASVVVARPGEAGTSRLPIPGYLTLGSPALVLAVELGPPGPGSFRRVAMRPGFAPALASVAGTHRGGHDELWAGAVAARPIFLRSGELPPASALQDGAPVSAWYRRRLLEVLSAEVRAELAAQVSAQCQP